MSMNISEGRHLGSTTLTGPEEMISTDFPQNLFFHLWSANRADKKRTLGLHVTCRRWCRWCSYLARKWNSQTLHGMLRWGDDGRPKKRDRDRIAGFLNTSIQHVKHVKPLPARWCSGILCLLSRSHRSLQGRGWMACSDISRTPRHSQRWRMLQHKPKDMQESQLFISPSLNSFSASEM